MSIWRRLLLPVFILITISGIVFHAPPTHALSKDELIKEYRKQAGLKWLCDHADKMVSVKGGAADRINGYFPSTTVMSGQGYGANAAQARSVGDIKGNLNNLLGREGSWDDANFVRELMLGLGYKWQGDTFTHPGAAAVCSNAANKYNGGKKADVTSAPMKWAKASSELEDKCEINRLGKPADIRATMGDKVELARTNGEDGDGWTYVLVNEITDSGTIEEVIYGVDRKDSWGGDRECVDLAKQASSNAKPAVEGAKKATTEARSNAAGRYIAEELCRSMQSVSPDEYSGCVSDISKKSSKCFRDSGEDIQKIKNCLKASLPVHHHKEITEDLIKRALEHAKNSTQDQTITGGAAENEEDQPTCAITGIGWIICPTMNFIATLNDAMFDLVSLLLAARPDMFIMEDSNQTYAAWGVFRNIANVAFVIVFLVVIFSQVTSQGISNYGIKRILPRLIIGAILINTSFLISALAADVSSILGSSIKGFLEQAAASSQPVDNWNWGHMVGFILGGGGLTATAGVAGLAALWAIGIPGAIAFLVAMLMTLLILIGRQAGIILLATLSPLAFAALILPNTEKWFKRWMSMFGGLLMVFPVVSLLFGAGSFAATILNNNNDYVMQIAALIVSALPLVATPMLLRKSMDSLGTIGQMAGRLGDKANSFATKTAREGMSENSRLNEAWKGMKFNRQLKKAEHRASGKGIGGRLDRSKIGRKFGLDRGAYAAQEAVDKAAEADAERKLAYEYNGDAVSALNDDNTKVRAAAAKQLAGQGDWGAGQLATYIQNGGKVDSIAMANALTSVKSSHAGVAKVGTEALHSLQTGGSSYSTDESGFQKLTADSMDGFTNAQYAAQSVRAISDAVAANGISADKASEILNDPTVGKDIKGGTGVILGGLRNAAAIKQSGANPGYIAYSDEQLVGSIAASTTGMSASEIKSLTDLGFIGKNQANRILKGAQTSNTEINKILQDFTSKP